MATPQLNPRDPGFFGIATLYMKKIRAAHPFGKKGGKGVCK